MSATRSNRWRANTPVTHIGSRLQHSQGSCRSTNYECSAHAIRVYWCDGRDIRLRIRSFFAGRVHLTSVDVYAGHEPILPYSSTTLLYQSTAENLAVARE